MLKCTKCQELKPKTAFHLKTAKKRGRQFVCKHCRQAYSRDWYAKNRERLRQEAVNRKNTKKQWLADLKTHLKCVQCNFSHPAALVFHHRNPAKKRGNISEIVFAWKTERILAEIAKCDVLCANCHRVLHFKLRNSLVA